MYAPNSPPGYTYADTSLYGIVDVLDHAGNVLAMNVTIGQANAMVERWQTDETNPYLEALDRALLGV